MNSLLNELKALPPNTAIRLTERARETLINALSLVNLVDLMMAKIGYSGALNADDVIVNDVLAALNKIDPK